MAVSEALQAPDVEAPTIAARSPWNLFWDRFRKDRLAMAGLGFVAFFVVVAISAPLIVKLVGAPDPNFQDREALDAFGTPTGPSAEHWFGVDNLGRDVFSRTIYGARVSLLVAVLATGLATIGGVVAGLLSGYFRGWTDTIVSRSVDVFLAVPYLLLATGLAASCSLGDGCFGGLIKPGIAVVIFVIAVTTWTLMARIMFREILPNLVAPIIVYASILIPQVILFEAALSFLGVGVQPPTASWGQMIAEATTIFNTAWWYMLFPGLALLTTVLAFNLVGDALHDALHPRARRSA